MGGLQEVDLAEEPALLRVVEGHLTGWAVVPPLG